MMKARLAKKLAQTSIDRLAPYWINKFVCQTDVTQGLKKHWPSGGRENRENKNIGFDGLNGCRNEKVTTNITNNTNISCDLCTSLLKEKYP